MNEKLVKPAEKLILICKTEIKILLDRFDKPPFPTNPICLNGEIRVMRSVVSEIKELLQLIDRRK